MIGNKGTINGFVKVQCNCGRRSAYCHHPWHHVIVNEYDIGNIQRLRIMVGIKQCSDVGLDQLMYRNPNQLELT